MMEMCEFKFVIIKVKKNKGFKMYGIGNKLIVVGKVIKVRLILVEMIFVNGFFCFWVI